MVIVTVIKNNSSKYNLDVENFNIVTLHKSLNNKNKLHNFALLNIYDFDNEIVELWGYKKGKECNINKFELPESDIYYDELIFLSKDEDGNLIDLTNNDFEEFYNQLYEGFEDLDEDTDDFNQDDDYISDDGFVIKD